MPKLTPYIFSQNAREQSAFYAAALGAELISVRTFGEIPGFPEERKDSIMHLVMQLGEIQLFMADADIVQSGTQLDLAVEFETEDQARQAFDALSRGGQVLMQMESMPWGTLLGRVQDRYGLRWQIANIAK